MKKNWKIITKESQKSGKQKKDKAKNRIFSELEEVMENILLSRGIVTEEEKREFLYPDYDKDIHNPFLLSDMYLAVERILQAKELKELVCIYGDYDADGITSTSILADFFKQIGIKNFAYLPDRNKEGYGINKKAIDYIFKKGASLIVTVDCGITSVSEVEYAKDKLDIIITDHHFVPKKIPAALAVINPKKEKDAYPEKMLAGVGVTFKLIQAVAQKINDYDLGQLKWLLDLVAVGSIADCVPLLGENRTLTKFGLIVLSKTKKVGLKQLFEVGRIKINSSQLPTGEQVGFQIAPRINAAGRMDHASIAYKLLTKDSNETAEARLLALEIESQNKHRQKVTEEIVKEVEESLDKNNLPGIIIRYSPHWPLGIIGLVAGRIADRYHRPTIILQEQKDLLKGSCRSVPGFNIMETLSELEDLLEKFGGHSQAAGLTLKKEKLTKVKKKLNDLVANIRHTKQDIEIHQQVKLSEINQKLLDELSLLEPYGQGNPKPIFISKNVVVKKVFYMGNEGQHLKIWVSDNGFNLELVSFNFRNKLIDLQNKDLPNLEIGINLNIVYSLEENIWNGVKNIQGHLIDLQILKKKV